MTLHIVDEQPDFLVVNKPAGLAVQDETNQPGILPVLYAETGMSHLHLVHRLDKVTSGLLLLAKNKQAAAAFGELFSARHIDKYYVALSTKKPRKKQGLVAGDMHKVRDGKWMLRDSLEKPAVTQFFNQGISEGVRASLLKPLTGKTHQLRVMLKSQASPIMGDTLYGGLPSDRTYLHAFAVAFDYDGQRFAYTANPQDGQHFREASFLSWLRQHAQPWTLQWPAIPHKYLKITGRVAG